MSRYHDVEQLTTAELERAKRELQANLGLITPIPLHTCQSGLTCRQSTPNFNVPVTTGPAWTNTASTKDLPARRLPSLPGRAGTGTHESPRPVRDWIRHGPGLNTTKE